MIHIDRSLSSLTPEMRVLVACARAGIDKIGGSFLEENFSKVSDWDGLVRLAEYHGLLQFLHRHLGETISGDMPEDVLSRIRERSEIHARRNLVLFGELARIITLLESRGITGIPFKGPVLADFVYGDLAIRQAGDLDVIVPKEAVASVEELLTAEGYRPITLLTPRQWTAYKRRYGSLSFSHSKKRWVVDVHWDLVRDFFPYSLDAMDLARRLQVVSFGEWKVMMPSREDMLLILSVHGSKHHWSRLVWIADIAHLCSGIQELDWDRVIGEAARLEIRRFLYVALVLARNIFDTEFPPGVAKAVDKDLRACFQAGRIGSDLGAIPDEHPVHRAFKKALFHLRSMDRFRHKVRYCFLWAVLPNINDWTAVKLPDALFFMYFVIRPFRLVFHYARVALGGGRNV